MTSFFSGKSWEEDIVTIVSKSGGPCPLINQSEWFSQHLQFKEFNSLSLNKIDRKWIIRRIWNSYWEKSFLLTHSSHLVQQIATEVLDLVVRNNEWTPNLARINRNSVEHEPIGHKPQRELLLTTSYNECLRSIVVWSMIITLEWITLSKLSIESQPLDKRLPNTEDHESLIVWWSEMLVVQI